MGHCPLLKTFTSGDEEETISSLAARFLPFSFFHFSRRSLFAFSFPRFSRRIMTTTYKYSQIWTIAYPILRNHPKSAVLCGQKNLTGYP